MHRFFKRMEQRRCWHGSGGDPCGGSLRELLFEIFQELGGDVIVRYVGGSLVGRPSRPEIFPILRCRLLGQLRAGQLVQLDLCRARGMGISMDTEDGDSLGLGHIVGDIVASGNGAGNHNHDHWIVDSLVVL